MTAVVLAIEASQRRGGVAVEHGGRTDVEWMSADVRHDDDLLPAIVRLYKRCALVPGMTDAVGVSIGPGGFTGLRIAVSTGKMMAEATGAKIVAVPTALVVAEYKWQFFDDLIPSQHWLKQRMDELENARNFIAHNRMLLPSEFDRIYMYIADWVIGL